MIKNRYSAINKSRKSLNDLIRLYELNYLKLMKLLPIREINSKFNFFIPEGLYNSEIRISINRKQTLLGKSLSFQTLQFAKILHVKAIANML